MKVVRAVPSLNKSIKYFFFIFPGNICKKDNPCVNDAICGYTRGGYICKCPAGWEGDNCDIG